jgi:multidrug efflux pump subunit AcrA (membrane-fusion protein)
MPERPHDPSQHSLASTPESQPDHRLPWPDESRPATLGEEFAHTEYAQDRRLGASFADPNSIDDSKLGQSFLESNSSAKKQHAHDGKPHKPADRATFYRILIVFLLIVVLVFVLGWLLRRGDNNATDKAANARQHEKPIVDVARAHHADNPAGLTLPGTTIPLTEAFVYARANGYLKSRLVDIGDHVRKGQLLATIEAPDLDAQADQAREQLRQAQSQLELQKSQLALNTVTVQRYRVLVAKGVFSRQEGDQQEANYASQQANVAAAARNVQAFKANLDRTLALQSYEQVRAPFSGVITQRNVDVGALISAGGASSGAMSGPAPMGQTSISGGSQEAAQANSAGTTGSTSNAATPAQSPGQGGPLFGIAQTQRLRVLISVPETYAQTIRVGGQALLAFEEYGAQTFTGDITRTADSIDPNTRTMLTEVQVANPDGKLFAGMYTLVTLPPPPGANTPILVKGDAVAIRKDKPVVAILEDIHSERAPASGNDEKSSGSNSSSSNSSSSNSSSGSSGSNSSNGKRSDEIQVGTVHLVAVTLGRDFGDTIEIVHGVQDGDIVVVGVTDDVIEGAQVQLHTLPPTATKAAATPKSTSAEPKDLQPSDPETKH